MAVSHQGDTGETGTDEGGRSGLTDTWRCAGFISHCDSTTPLPE